MRASRGREGPGHTNDRSRRAVKAAGYLLVLSFVAAFCLYPLLTIARMGLEGDDGGLTTDNFVSLFTDDRWAGILTFTVVQAAVSAVLTVLAAFPGAYLLSRYRVPGRSLLLSLSTVPFVLPPLVLSVGFVSLFSAGGYLSSLMERLGELTGAAMPELDILYTKEVIVLAHIFFNFPIALRVLLSRLETMDRRTVDAAGSLGAGALRTFFRVVLPQMRYSIIASLSLIFTFCLLSFSVVLVVGGMTNATMEVEMFRQFSGRLDFGMAGAMLIAEMLLVMASTFIYLWSSRRAGSSEPLTIGAGPGRKGAKGPSAFRVVTMVVYIVVVGTVIIGPLLAVALDSFTEGPGPGTGLSTLWYERVLSRERDPVLGVSPFGAVLNSLAFGALTVFVSVPLSLVTAYLLRAGHFRSKRVLDMLLLFPLGASGVALGYGLIKAYSGGGLPLIGTWYVVVMVHSVIAFPLGARVIHSKLQEVPRELNRAARSLGASPVEAYLRVELPLIMPGILIAAVFAFAVSIGELGATIMVSTPELMTMPVALYRFVGNREFGTATAYAVVLMLVTLSSFLVMELLHRGASGRWSRR